MKKLFISILTLVAAFALVGCGGDKTKGNGTAIADDNYTAETIENLKAQEEDSVKVSFRIPFGKEIQDVIREFADEFEAEYPSVAITLDVISGYDSMKDTTITDINGGKAPTMTVGYPDHFAEYLISKSIISLDKFIKDPNVGYTDEELGDFLPGYVEENRQFDKVGSYVGLPFNKSTEAMYYNIDFFEKFNLEVPETWDEFKETSTKINEFVKTLKDDDYEWLPGIATHLANDEFIPCMYDSGGNLFTTIIHQFGGDYTESIFKSNGIVDVQRGSIKFNTSAEAKEGIKYLQDLAKENLFNMPEKMDMKHGSGAISQGQNVMNIGSTGGSSYYSDAKCRIGVAPIPYRDAEHKYVIQQGTNVCILSQASDLQKLAAWLFIKHMLEPQNTARFAIETGYMPVRESAYEDEAYLDFLKGPSLKAQVQKATSNYASEGWNYFVDAAWAGSSTVRKECEAAIATILVDNANIDKALEDAINRIG